MMQLEVFIQMRGKRELNVLYMGGSITYGACATKYENSWASKISNYLKRRFTGCSLKFFNAAVSGTGTAFGIFRLNEHVLRYKPDIVFIEFAVNDSGDAVTDQDKVTSSLDYIISELIRSNPSTKIIMLYSAMKGWNACAGVHDKVARHYNVPSINLQEHIKSLVDNSVYSWDELFADEVHPNDIGHQVYYQYIVESMEKDWGKYFGSNPIAVPGLASYTFCLPRMVGFEDVRLKGNWEIKSIEDRYKHIDRMKIESVLLSEEPGSLLEMSFFGSHIGLYHLLDRHCGVCSITIDDEEEVIKDFFYKTDNEFVSFFSRFGLTNGEHKLKIEVLKSKNPQSMGNIIAIAKFLIG
jgi:lysophospholipase L1-like esterase